MLQATPPPPSSSTSSNSIIIIVIFLFTTYSTPLHHHHVHRLHNHRRHHHRGPLISKMQGIWRGASLFILFGQRSTNKCNLLSTHHCDGDHHDHDLFVAIYYLPFLSQNPYMCELHTVKNKNDLCEDMIRS